MYKIKIFKDWMPEIEEKIQKWLKENPNIVIERYEQTNNDSTLYISIIYTEKQNLMP